MNRMALLLSLLCAGTLAACKTTDEAPPPQLTAEQIATAQSQWTGTWSGTWLEGGSCSSSIEVQEVTGTSAVATYSWGSGCGGRGPGSRTDSDARISGDVITLSLTWGWGVQYTIRPDGNLDGEFWTRGRKNVVTATFYKE